MTGRIGVRGGGWTGRARSTLAALAVGVAVGAVGAGFGGTLSAGTDPGDDPAEYLEATGESPGEEELAYWASVVPCPEEIRTDDPGDDGSLSRVAPTGGPDTVGLNCLYDGVSEQIDVWWEKPGAERTDLCGSFSHDFGARRVLADPDRAAIVDVARFGLVPRSVEVDAAAVEALFAFASARAATCDLTDVPTCPEIDGWVTVRRGLPSRVMDTEFSRSCEYTAADETATATHPVMSFSVIVHGEHGELDEEERQVLCSTPEWFAYGAGGLSLRGEWATTAEYVISSSDPIPTEPLVDAARSVMTEYAPLGADCAGVELLPDDPYTPLPAYLADVFADDRVDVPPPPIVDAEPPPSTSPAPDASVPAEAAPSDSEPGESEPGASPDVPVDSGPAADDGSADVDPASAAPAVDPGTGTGGGDGGGDGDGTLATVWRVLTVVALVLSLALLALTFWLIRRESRVRPALDVVRIVATLVALVAALVLLPGRTPAGAIAIAVAVGAVLGWWQGRNLVVRVTERGVFARRNAWAVAAFAAGLLVSQVAGLLKRSGAVSIGFALMAFSVALAVGLLGGRTPRLRSARSATGGTGGTGAVASLILLVAVAAVAVPTTSDGRADAQEDGGVGDDEQPTGPAPAGLPGNVDPVLPEERTEVMEHLIDTVPWDEVRLTGGLFAFGAKPPAVLSVPRALDEPPEPLTRTVSFTDQLEVAGASAIDVDVTETFTFSLRDDGFCCAVDYEGTGTLDSGDGPLPYSASGRLDDIGTVAVEGITDTAIAGLPFAEVSPFDAVDPSTGELVDDCGRPVAATRTDDALAATAGEADLLVEVPDATGGVIDSFAASPAQMRVSLLAPCELAGFSIDDALSVVPPPPPSGDPERAEAITSSLSAFGCPVRQELIGALHERTAFEGVDTRTLGELYLDPNANVCRFGALLEPPAIGQGGPGQTRNEFAIDLALPRRGEWDRGYDRWYPDPCCITLPTVMQPPSDDICALGDDGVPVRPDDGSNCSYVSQHQLPTGQIWIEVEYVPDGPNTTIRAELPWGAFYSRCHHCEPGDENVIGFLDAIMDVGADLAADISLETTVVGDDGATAGGAEGAPAPSEDDGALDSEAASGDTSGADGPDAAQTVDPDGAGQEPAAPAEDSGEPGDLADLADLFVDDAASDVERDAALAALAGLTAAGLLGMTSVAEAGTRPRDLYDAWRRGGGAAVDELLRDSAASDDDPGGEGAGGAADGPADDVGDGDGLVSAWDPNRDNGPDEPPGGFVRVSSAERDRLEGIDRAQRRSDRLERDAAELADIRAERERHDAAMAAIEQEAIDHERRDALELQQRLNEAEAAMWNDPITALSAMGLDALSGMGQDLADTPGALHEVARRTGIRIRGGLDAAHDALSDPENWRIAGDTAAGTLRDAAGLLVGDDEAYTHLHDGAQQMSDTAGALAEAVAADRQGAIEAMLGVDRLRAAADPDRPLADRLDEYSGFAAEMFIGWLSAGGSGAARLADATEELADAGRLARAAERGGDAASATRLPTPARLTDEALAARRQAWDELQQMAASRADDVERAVDDLAVARRAGDPAEVAAAEQRARDAVLRAQADKATLQEMNRRSAGTREAFNDLLQRNVYDPVDERVVQDIARRQPGFDAASMRRAERLDDGTWVYRDAAGNEVHVASPTNPSSTVKVGADRDVTIRTRAAGSDAPVDVPFDESAPVYHRALSDTVGDPARLGLPDDPAALARRLDQEVTSTFHPEAYTDLDTILYHPDGSLRDPQQIRMAMEYKGVHWTNRFDEVPDARLAEDVLAEGMRQMSKQFDNQVVTRFDAMNDLRRTQGLEPLRMPERLRESHRILAQVNPKPPARPTLSPAEAERMLNELGTSPGRFADEMGAFTQMVEMSRRDLG